MKLHMQESYAKPLVLLLNLLLLYLANFINQNSTISTLPQHSVHVSDLLNVTFYIAMHNVHVQATKITQILDEIVTIHP